ncbi:MAG: hypothetical protein KF729_08765 [Sandaracinaceae bacterium]|nr:hypothetical protein [Sandaracinaceae bacterium]
MAVATGARLALEGPVWLADRARWLWLRALGPLAKPLVRRRELRVALAGTSMIALSFAGAVALPMWLLALGPVVWGTPHVLSDLRYLWVRPGWHRRWALWLLVVVPLALATLTAHPAWGFGAAIGAIVGARGSLARKSLALALALALLWVALAYPALTAVVFAHAHNFIGVAIFWAWRRRAGKLHYLPLALFALGSLVLVSGALDSAVLALGALGTNPGGLDVYYHLASLSPGVEGMLGVRLVLLFAFAQSVHYAVWVRLVPEEDRKRETPRTFAASLRALRADLGPWVLGAAIVVTLAVAVWAAWDVFAARNGYLRMVLFHGHLEVAAACLLFIEGMRPRESTEGAPA